MDTRWLEDFIALAATRSITRAAAERHVTHPAFGRRIKSLEAWLGVALIEPGRSPVQLTPAGTAFLQTAAQTLAALDHSRERLLRNERDAAFRIGTGRTLARTLLADWLAKLQPMLGDHRVDVVTGSLAPVAAQLESGAIDFLLGYHHPALAFNLDAQRYRFVTMTRDRLVPIVRTEPNGRPPPDWPGRAPIRFIGYSRTLALGRLIEDHLERLGAPLALDRVLHCDSADAAHSFVQKGLGAAWLPWSLVASDCKAKRLTKLGGRTDEIHFEVRLWRSKNRLPAVAEAAWSHAVR